MIAQKLLKNAVKLDVRWQGQHVNKNEIPIAPCGATHQPCCAGACESDACSNGICQSCGGVGQPCCPGRTCSAGVCDNNFCVACGQSGTPCCPGEVCPSGVCRAGVCATCGDIGQPCCNGESCGKGQCKLGMCAACGNVGQPCCQGRCDSGVCSNGSCSACGEAGQPCCPNSSCLGSNFCRQGTCTTCATPVPCGNCGGTVQCDGSCSRPTPTNFGVTREYSSDNEKFACCFIDYKKTFGGDCSPGWVYHSPVSLKKNSGGGTCEIISQGSGGDCRVTVRFHNNGTDGADCTIKIRERRACD